MKQKDELRDADPNILLTGIVLLLASISLLILLPNAGIVITVVLVFFGILGLGAFFAYYLDMAKKSIIDELKKNK